MLTKELQTFLNNNEGPVCNLLKIIDNAIKCSELTMQHKEIVFLKWIIGHSSQAYSEYWSHLNSWLKSPQFKKLDKNDINREEFISIIELINEELLQMDNINNSTMRIILDCIVLLISSNIFQHYFNYHMDIYFKLISSMLHKIDCSEYLKEFLKMDLFYKHISDHGKYQKSFIFIIIPRLIGCLNKFERSEIFEQVSKLIQKGVFYKNHKSFKVFIDHFFQCVKIEKQPIPKSLFKYILEAYQTDDAVNTYKVLFHAFCAAYGTDFELILKFFMLLVHIIGFDLKDKLIFHKTAKLDLPKSDLYLNKSQEILLVLLDVLNENKNDSQIMVNNINFSEFIKNILRQILYLNIPSETSYNIFVKAIAIDPLVVEPITNETIIYTLIFGRRNYQYEMVIISIFDVYLKLRRIENLIYKMVHTLYNHFTGQHQALEEVYKFKGEVDSKGITVEENIQTDNIFTDNILRHLSKCICNLASWQIINIFKTLLYQLQQILNDIDKNERIVNFMGIVSVLLDTLLSSVRIAEHTVVVNVVEKSLKELDELRNMLKQFGMVLLNREHDEQLMRSFLNIAYNWAELHIILEYYSIGGEVYLTKLTDNDSKACNITYLHSYLNVKQWCLISERITNFGEAPCKQLLEKLYIQKLRAMVLFEKSVNEDVIQNIVKSISANIEFMWKDILIDKYVVNNLLPKMGSSLVVFLAEKLVANIDTFRNTHDKPHISDSILLVTAINYVVINKINKLLIKKKHKMNDEMVNKATSIKILSELTADNFFNEESQDIIENVKILYRFNEDDNKIAWSINAEKVYHLIQILERFPVISCSENVQKLCLIYFLSLHRDLSSHFKNRRYNRLQSACERMIVGILQHWKFKLSDLFEAAQFCKEIVENYDKWEHIFTLVTENVFKDEHSVLVYEPVVLDFTTKLLTPVYIRCCIILINIASKMKKVKASKNIKSTTEKYKTTICDKILNAVTENEPSPVLIDGFSCALRHFLLSKEEEKLSKLLNKLEAYVNLALEYIEHVQDVNYFMLFITVLENKVKMQPIVGDDFLLKTWNMCKEKHSIVTETDKYVLLVKLIFGLASNEEFATIAADLLKVTNESATVQNYETYAFKLNIWESVLSCNLNPVKLKILQSALEKLLQKFILLLQQNPPENLYENIFNLQKTIIQTNHLPLTPPIVDLIILSTTLLCGNCQKDKLFFNSPFNILESLLKHRKSLIMDRLPSFLQLYRTLLSSVCGRSNTDLNLEADVIKEVSDYSHQLEKLTKNLITCHKDMGRIAMYLIADILNQYEQITLHPNVKIHLNNCMYSLLTICDQHAISFLMRSLSSASTEMFKATFENYKKFYRFTGKV